MFSFVDRIIENTGDSFSFKSSEVIPHKVHCFGSIGCGMVVHHFKRNPGSLSKLKAYRAVFSSRSCHDKRLLIDCQRHFGGFLQPHDSNFFFIHHSPPSIKPHLTLCNLCEGFCDLSPLVCKPPKPSDADPSSWAQQVSLASVTGVFHSCRFLPQYPLLILHPPAMPYSPKMF